MDRLSHSDGMRGFRPPVNRPRPHDWAPEGHTSAQPERAEHNQRALGERLGDLDKCEFALGERSLLLRMTKDVRPRFSLRLILDFLRYVFLTTAIISYCVTCFRVCIMLSIGDRATARKPFLS